MDEPFTPGRYDVGPTIATGGMGAIRSAEDRQMRRTVAMKVMLAHRRHQPEARGRFLQEARVLGQLEHPNIVPIHELASDADGGIYYTMKLVQGRTLQAVLNELRRGDPDTLARFPLHRLLSIFLKVCDGVAFAHSRGIIHRDLKPENIMLGDFGEVLVMDWGLAKILAGGAPAAATLRTMNASQEHLPTVTEVPGITVSAGHLDATAVESATSAPELVTLGVVESEDTCDSVAPAQAMLTLEGAVMGTPAFMAPEQAAGRGREQDTRTDIYALGGILYAILALRPPVQGASVREVTDRVLVGDIKPPATCSTAASVAGPHAIRGALPAVPKVVTEQGKARGDMFHLAHCPGGRVPEALSLVTMTALALKPGERYQTVGELRREIESFQTGFATTAEHASFWRQVFLLVRRRRTEAVLLAASFVVLLLVSAGFVAQLNREKNAALGTLNKLKGTAPTYFQQSRALAAEGQIKEALAKIDYALSLVPDEVVYHEQQGNLYQTLLRLDEAVASYDRALKLDPDHTVMAENRALCLQLASRRAAQDEWSAPQLQQLHAALLKQHRAGEARVVADGWRGQEVAVTALLETWRTTLAAGGITARVLEVDREGRFTLKCMPGSFASLAVLKGMPLRQLDIPESKVADLRPLAGAPLESLDLTRTEVTDLSPLKGMPLRRLIAKETPLRDLSPLRGMALTNLNLLETRVADLSPLRGMPLVTFNIVSTALADLEPLRGMPLREVTIQFGAVGSISALAGMKLEYLNLRGLPISDLTPLHGMTTLGTLSLAKTRVSNLSPLSGLAVTNLYLESALVNDLTPLTGMKLVRFNCTRSNLENISALRGMPLEYLELSQQAIRDISVLQGMPLKELRLDGCGRLKDITVLASLTQLEKLALPQGAKQIEFLRYMPRLKWLQASDNADIQLTPAAEFWKAYDAKKDQK